jgi:hypothetical protein
LVATVVPWATSPISSAPTFSIARMNAVAGSLGEEGTLVLKTRPAGSTATTSVNVPPVSMPMRTPLTST